jgi:hypothetical protein
MGAESDVYGFLPLFREFSIFNVMVGFPVLFTDPIKVTSNASIWKN